MHMSVKFGMSQPSIVTLTVYVMLPVGSDSEEEREDVQRPASTSQGTLYTTV